MSEWLPEQTVDDTDVGWGDDEAAAEAAANRDRDWYERERPPHHEG